MEIFLKATPSITYFFLKIKVWLIYKIMFISATQQSDLVMEFCMYICIIFISLSVKVYHKILNIVPSALQ